PMDQHAEVPREYDESGTLVGELEFAALDVALIVAPALDIILDRDLHRRRRLLARELREIEIRIAARAGPHIIEHVGEAEPAKLCEHSILRYFGALGAFRLRFP